MRIFARRLGGRLAAGVALGLILSPLAASAEEVANPSAPFDAVVLPAELSRPLAPIGAGLADWISQRLVDAGLELRQDARVRAAVAALDPEGKNPRLLTLAARAGARHALLFDAEPRGSAIAFTLRLHDAASGEVLALGRAFADSQNLSVGVEQALRKILPALGATQPLTASRPASGAEFAAYSRALEQLDKGELAAALQSVGSHTGRGPRNLTARIEVAAAAPGLPLAERARWLSAKGQEGEAWSLLEDEAARALGEADPDPRLLSSAGEAQRLRGSLAEARVFYERAFEAEQASPGSAPSAALGLARTLLEAGGQRSAIAPLTHAARSDPDDPEAPRLLAEIPGQSSHQKADALLRSAERSARRLEVDTAQRLFERAIAADPGREAEAREMSAQLHASLGAPRVAQLGFERAVAAGGVTPARKLGIARALESLGEPEEAAEAYIEVAGLAPNDPVALSEVGDFLGELGRVAEGRVHLERALSLEARDPRVQRSLARSLALTGDNERALEVFETAEALAPAPASDLRIMAAVQRTMGRVAESRVALERAAALDPASVAVQQDLAAIYSAAGTPEQIERSRRTLQVLASAGLDSREGGSGAIASGAVDEVFAALVASFPERQRRETAEKFHVAVVGIRKEHDWSQWRAWLPDWLLPEHVDLVKLENDLVLALSQHYNVEPSRRPSEYNEANVDQLFGFSRASSLDARALASVNMDLGAESSFIAQVSAPSQRAGLCSGESDWAVELRRLDGDSIEAANILANDACLPNLLASHATWNPRAAVLYAVVVLGIVALVVRGWGTIVVQAHVPENTIALFSISVSRRPRRVKRHKDLASGRAEGRYRKRLRRSSLFERKLDQGKENVFRWIPARRKPIYLTVRGPLLDSFSEELIGDFLEERVVEVTRGETVRVDFDMRPKEATIQVTVLEDGNAADQAMISVRGQPKSLRYLKQGHGFLYLRPGSYVVMAGARDRVVESALEVGDCQALPLTIDMGRESNLLFEGCRDAVAPCLESNFEAAGERLLAAGLPEKASLLRALAHRGRGNVCGESEALEAAGLTKVAAELRAEHSSPEEAGSLFEKAGEPARAAEAHRERGDLASAARAYEEAYDWENAIDCYQSLGDHENLIAVLERSGDLFEAGRTAASAGQPERALAALQKVDARHPHYSEACRMLAGLLVERDEHDFALEKFDEAKRVGGLENFPIEVQDQYGKLLEEVGRSEDALSVYAEMRRRDLHYRDVSTRIENLKKQLSQVAPGQTEDTAPSPVPVATPVTTPSRYEILEELGRGGMGVVYKARDRHLGRVVALKRLPDELRGHPTAVRFFEREARAAAALNHRNIVTIYDAGQDEGNYFISMELLEGTEIDAILRKRGALSVGIASRIGIQVATGLHYAHERRIIHRDIKTANLFFTTEKVVKIMDFGLAKMLEEVRRASTVIGGTPYYMPPEQATGGAVDHRADLYSLGVTLFQLVTGRVPFADGDMTYQHAHTPAPDAREFVATLPAEMAALLRKLMAKAPEERCQSAQEVVAALSTIAKAATQPDVAG